MIKLIASDLDGTLLNGEGIMGEKIFELINNLHKKGITFAAASGRFYSQLSHNFENVKEDMLFIAHNGALVKYNRNGETIYESPISKENIRTVLKLQPKCGEEVFLASENNAYIINPTEEMLNRFDYFKVPVVKIKSFDEVKETIYKITYFINDGIKPEVLDYMENNLSDDLDFVASGDQWLDIMNKDVSKGKAVNMLQRKLNIDKKNTMVFGDYYNDVEMFKSAHYSYAMKNAPDDVKEQANFIAESNNDNGVYKAIKERCLSKEKLA